MQYRQFFDAATVRSTRDALARLLRIVFHRRKITTDDFVRLHGDYWNYWNRGGQNESASTHRNNQRRTLNNNKISWNKFSWLIEDLLRLDVIELAITVREPGGKEITYSTRDPIEDDPTTTYSTNYLLGDDPAAAAAAPHQPYQAMYTPIGPQGTDDTSGLS